MVMEFDYNQILENVQVNNIILAAAGDGVISGLDVSERGAGVNMSVNVATGSALINGTTYTESSIVNLAISAADATHARKDLVIYDVTTTNPLVVTGTPATPPIPPDITTGNILLAIVNVAANETEITNSEIIDCIVEIQRLDELGAPTDITALNASISAHGLLKKLSNSAAEFMNGQGDWATPAGAGDMTKAVYDTNAYLGVVDQAIAAGNSGTVDGCNAGTSTADVWKIPNSAIGTIYQHSGSAISSLAPSSTTGYQVTSLGTNSMIAWSAASDLIFSDTHCPKCGLEFQDGDNLILHLIGHNEVGDILTLPMHISCANEPKKTVMIKRKVMEDRHILDEETGELKVQRVQKTQEKTVTRHKLKEGYVIDGESGKAHTVDSKGKRGKTAHNLTVAIKEIEETINEIVYEDVEYDL